jgi:hypothetical protein
MLFRYYPFLRAGPTQDMKNGKARVFVLLEGISPPYSPTTTIFGLSRPAGVGGGNGG